jgi:CheY-like chemotaxis protein
MSTVKILVVEDEGILQLDLVARLSDLGYTAVAVASSGEQAIREAARAQPDLVLMDIRLKGPMDGIDTASILRRSADIPIIFTTALDDSATAARVQALAPAGYLTKPFRDGEIEQAIREALQHRQIGRETER